MKKYILTALFILSMSAISFAGGELRSTPRGDPQALATADYGGVDYATAAFSSDFTTCTYLSTQTSIPSAQGVFYGIMFSSGVLGALDFVDVFDSTSVLTRSAVIVRLYNTASTTGSVVNNGSYVGFAGPPKPIRFRNGLIFKASVATYNMITGLFYKEP